MYEFKETALFLSRNIMKGQIANFIEKEDIVLYFDVRTKKFLKALVVCVHKDDIKPYFTIKTEEKELQTTSERLFIHADKTISF